MAKNLLFLLLVAGCPSGTPPPKHDPIVATVDQRQLCEAQGGTIVANPNGCADQVTAPLPYTCTDINKILGCSGPNAVTVDTCVCAGNQCWDADICQTKLPPSQQCSDFSAAGKEADCNNFASCLFLNYKDPFDQFECIEREAICADYNTLGWSPAKAKAACEAEAKQNRCAVQLDGTCGPPKPSSAGMPQKINWSYLKDTSVADGGVYPNGDEACPIKKIPFFRGSGGHFFPLDKVIKNMIGITSVEYPSWRATDYLTQQGVKPDMATPEVWEILKVAAISEINSQLNYDKNTRWAKQTNPKTGQKYTPDYGPFKKCVLFAQDAEAFTWEGQPYAQKIKSWGTAVISDFGVTKQYAKEGLNAGDATIIEIKEKVPRAGLVTNSRMVPIMSGGGLYTRGGSWPGQEFYIPVSIPAHDISRAWSQTYSGNHGHSLEKIESSDGLNLIEIKIYKESTFPPYSAVVSGNYEGKIVPCSPGSACTSDPVPAGDTELKQIVDALPPAGVDGYKFRFTTMP